MATTPTANAVPSNDVADLLFNAEKLDEAINSGAFEYTDRLGRPRQTLAGATASIAAFNERGPWATATLYDGKDLVLESGTWYVCVIPHTSGATFAGDASNWRVHQGVTSVQLASTASPTDGAGMVGQPTEYANEQGTKVFAILGQRARVKRFWQSAHGADWTLAFQRASASGARRIIVEGDPTYQVSDQIDILSSQDWEFENADIRLTDDTKKLFSAVSRTNWSIRGMARLRGNLVSAATTAEVGLYIESCNRYVVENLQARNFKGKCLHLAGSSAGSLRGDRGQFHNVGAFESTLGILVDAGAGAEYNSWTNPNVSGNVTGWQMAAGNNTVVGGSIVDNTNGLLLTNGTNHGHGMFSGTNFNHNNSYNLQALAVLNGYTFTGCHFYGNGGTTGPIWFNGSKGITIADGTIDCPIYNDSGTGSGINKVSGNYFPGDYGVTLNTNNAALDQLWLHGNFDPDGLSTLNDPAYLAIIANRASSTQSLTAGSPVVAVFNNETLDNRKAYDPATGIYLVPAFAVGIPHRADVFLTVTAASGLAAGGYVEVRSNAVVVGYVPVVAVSGTLALATGSIIFTPTGQHNVDIRVLVNSGATTPVLALSVSRLSIQA